MEGIDFSGRLLFVAKTPDELSLVCESGDVPENVREAEYGWKAFMISGVLDFGMVGVVARISNILAEAKISIFVVSTYNTDYILLKDGVFDKGLQILECEGYTVNDYCK